jgi:hypothetical protein
MRNFEITDRRDVIAKRLDRYLSFPGLAPAGPGRILMAYRDGKSRPGTYSHGADGDLCLIRRENGRWSAPRTLYTHEDAVEEMGCGDLTRMTDGTIVLFSRQWDGGNSRTAGVYVASSADSGETFSPRTPVSAAGFHQWWVPYGKVIELPSGVWLLGGYGRRAEGEGASAACMESLDRGRSWRVRAWIGTFGCLGKLPLNEPLIFRLDGGELFVLIRTNGMFYSARSADDGRTWEPPAPAFEGMAGAGIILRGGELLVTYRGIHHGGPPPEQRVPTWPRKGRLYCCRLTADGGRTWTPEMSLDDNEALQAGSYGMGDALELDDGRVLVVFYTSDSDQAPWIQEVTLAPRDDRK